MARSHLRAPLIMCICIACSQIVLAWFNVGRVNPANPVACEPRTVEEHIACSVPIPLSTTTLIDLEEIPGVSPSIAERILAQKKSIQEVALILPEQLRYRALLTVKGIGAARAEKIARQMAIDQ